jgi:hypothetical protein
VRMKAQCADCHLLHAPDFHKSKRRNTKLKLEVGDRVVVLRSLRSTGMPVDADATGEVLQVASLGRRALVKFPTAQGWLDTDLNNLKKHKS